MKYCVNLKEMKNSRADETDRVLGCVQASLATLCGVPQREKPKKVRDVKIFLPGSHRFLARPEPNCWRERGCAEARAASPGGPGGVDQVGQEVDFGHSGQVGQEQMMSY